MRIPTHRELTHPGEMLSEEFLLPMQISPADLAQAIHLPLQQVDDLLNKNKPITPSMALRLAKFLGVSADYWLNLQMRWDLYQAQIAEKMSWMRLRIFIFFIRWLNFQYKSLIYSIILATRMKKPHDLLG